MNTSEINSFPLIKFPPVMGLIFKYLKRPVDVITLSETCRDFRQVALNGGYLERAQFEEVGIRFPELISAMGGIDAVYHFPVLKLKKEDDLLKLEMNALTAPVMRGRTPIFNRPFIAVASVNNSKLEVCTLFQKFNHFSEVWKVNGVAQRNLTMGMESFLVISSHGASEKMKIERFIILERLERFFKGEMIGQTVHAPLGEVPINFYGETPKLVGRSYEKKPSKEEGWIQLLPKL